jgi:hypothetical protein
MNLYLWNLSCLLEERRGLLKVKAKFGPTFAVCPANVGWLKELDQVIEEMIKDISISEVTELLRDSKSDG